MDHCKYNLINAFSLYLISIYIKFVNISMTTEEDIKQAVRTPSIVPAHYESRDKFQLSKTSRLYERQFNAMYTTRVSELKSRVFKIASGKWQNETINDTKCRFTPKILDIAAMTPCFVIGTVFCEYKYKNNILRDVSEHLYGAPEVKEPELKPGQQMSDMEVVAQSSYSDPATDQIMLEDESGRVVIDGELLDKIVLVTGAIVGLLGMEVTSGVFTVVDIVYPEPAPQLPLAIQAKETKRGKIMLVSGLNIDPDDIQVSSIEILKEFLMGELFDGVNMLDMQDICHLFICGNSMRVKDQKLIKDTKKDDKLKYRESNKSNYNATAMKHLDAFVSELLTSIPVTILPGESDPAEIAFPQQPLHKSLFRNSMTFPEGHFDRSTNPAWFEVNGVRMLGTSGENINDIMKYMIPNVNSIPAESQAKRSGLFNFTGKEQRLKVVESTILWQNIIPTAPDTLWCYPFEKDDPFVLKETPHVYFVGNQGDFETGWMEMPRKNGEVVKVRVVCVPVFSETRKAVVVDLDSTDFESSCIEVSI